MRLWVAALAGGLAFGAAAQSPPRFEEASIRPSPRPPTGPVGVRIGPTQARFIFVSLKSYIGAAYEVREVSGPAWMATEIFDIVAKMPENGAGVDQVPAMLRTLLEERFHLRTHRESRELPAYALELATGRPALLRLPDEPPPAGPFTVESGPAGGGQVRTLGDGGSFAISANRFEATRVTMGRLADLLGPFVDRPIVDRTGLEGRYTVALELTPDDFQALMARSVAAAGYPRAPEELRRGDAAAPVAVPEALERVGLKLRPFRAPFEVLVVDSIDRTPTAN